MSEPTVQEVWQLALPPGTTLAAGRGGLDRPVTWVVVPSTRPPAFAGLEGGELALLSMELARLVDDRLTLTRIVTGLAPLGVAAVAVDGHVSAEAVALADELNLPLLTLPAGTRLREVERAVTRLIVDREAQLDRRGKQIYRQLAQLSIENQGLAAIAQALSDLTHKPIVVQDEQLALCAEAWPEVFLPLRDEAWPALRDPAAVGDWLRGQPLDGSAPPATTLYIPPPGWVRRVAAVIIEGQLAGYLSLLSSEADLSDLDRLAAERGALVCAMEMAKARAVAAAEDRLRGDFLDALLAARPGDELVLARQAKGLGYPLDGKQVAVVFALGGDGPYPWPPLADEFQAVTARAGWQAMFTQRGEQMVVLCASPEGRSSRYVREAAEAARRCALQRRTDLTVTAGIGRPGAGAAGLRASFGEAQQAVTVGQRLLGGGGVFRFGDLGLYRLLAGLRDTGEAAAFYHETLAPLVAYDAETGSELVHTLETFFACHGNVSQTAEQLYLHRNSLAYRLGRIADITGFDLNDPEARLALHLALKLRPLFSDSR